jgi:lysozyme
VTQDELLISELKRDEGVIPHAYQDSLGYWTIGVGKLIDKRKGGRLSDAAIEYLLAEDIDSKVGDLDKNLPWWRNLTPARQRVMINMCFNLGIGGLMKFKNTLGMIERGDYTGASKNMLLSLWAKQVGARAQRLSKMMKEG